MRPAVVVPEPSVTVPEPPPAGVVHPPVPLRKWAELPSPTISALALAPEICHVTFKPFAPAVGVVSLRFRFPSAEPPFTMTAVPPEEDPQEGQLKLTTPPVL